MGIQSGNRYSARRKEEDAHQLLVLLFFLRVAKLLLIPEVVTLLADIFFIFTFILGSLVVSTLLFVL